MNEIAIGKSPKLYGFGIILPKPFQPNSIVIDCQWPKMLREGGG